MVVASFVLLCFCLPWRCQAAGFLRVTPIQIHFNTTVATVTIAAAAGADVAAANAAAANASAANAAAADNTAAAVAAET